MNNKSILYISYIIMVLLSITFGCADTGDNDSMTPNGSGESVSIPDVIISCSAASNCANNAAHHETAMAFYYIDLTVYAFGTTTVSCSSGTCTGTINSWKGENLVIPITHITEGTYNLSLGIDLNGDFDFADAGEPIAIDFIVNTISVNADTTSITPTTWTDAVQQ